MQTLYGMPIHIVDDYAVMAPSPEFRRLQSPVLVAELEAWMREFFGVKPPIPDGQVIKNMVANTLHMNRTTYRQLQAFMRRTDNAPLFPQLPINWSGL